MVLLLSEKEIKEQEVKKQKVNWVEQAAALVKEEEKINDGNFFTRSFEQLGIATKWIAWALKYWLWGSDDWLQSAVKQQEDFDNRKRKREEKEKQMIEDSIKFKWYSDEYKNKLWNKYWLDLNHIQTQDWSFDKFLSWAWSVWSTIWNSTLWFLNWYWFDSYAGKDITIEGWLWDYVWLNRPRRNQYSTYEEYLSAIKAYETNELINKWIWLTQRFITNKNIDDQFLSSVIALEDSYKDYHSITDTDKEVRIKKKYETLMWRQGLLLELDKEKAKIVKPWMLNQMLQYDLESVKKLNKGNLDEVERQLDWYMDNLNRNVIQFNSLYNAEIQEKNTSIEDAPVWANFTKDALWLIRYRNSLSKANDELLRDTTWLDSESYKKRKEELDSKYSETWEEIFKDKIKETDEYKKFEESLSWVRDVQMKDKFLDEFSKNRYNYYKDGKDDVNSNDIFKYKEKFLNHKIYIQNKIQELEDSWEAGWMSYRDKWFKVVQDFKDNNPEEYKDLALAKKKMDWSTQYYNLEHSFDEWIIMWALNWFTNLVSIGLSWAWDLIEEGRHVSNNITWDLVSDKLKDQHWALNTLWTFLTGKDFYDDNYMEAMEVMSTSYEGLWANLWAMSKNNFETAITDAALIYASRWKALVWYADKIKKAGKLPKLIKELNNLEWKLSKLDKATDAYKDMQSKIDKVNDAIKVEKKIQEAYRIDLDKFNKWLETSKAFNSLWNKVKRGLDNIETFLTIDSKVSNWAKVWAFVADSLYSWARVDWAINHLMWETLSGDEQAENFYLNLAWDALAWGSFSWLWAVFGKLMRKNAWIDDVLKKFQQWDVDIKATLKDIQNAVSDSNGGKWVTELEALWLLNQFSKWMQNTRIKDFEKIDAKEIPELVVDFIKNDDFIKQWVMPTKKGMMIVSDLMIAMWDDSRRFDILWKRYEEAVKSWNKSLQDSYSKLLNKEIEVINAILSNDKDKFNKASKMKTISFLWSKLDWFKNLTSKGNVEQVAELKRDLWQISTAIKEWKNIWDKWFKFFDKFRNALAESGDVWFDIKVVDALTWVNIQTDIANIIRLAKARQLEKSVDWKEIKSLKDLRENLTWEEIVDLLKWQKDGFRLDSDLYYVDKEVDWNIRRFYGTKKDWLMTALKKHWIEITEDEIKKQEFDKNKLSDKYNVQKFEQHKYHAAKENAWEATDKWFYVKFEDEITIDNLKLKEVDSKLSEEIDIWETKIVDLDTSKLTYQNTMLNISKDISDYLSKKWFENITPELLTFDHKKLQAKIINSIRKTFNSSSISYWFDVKDMPVYNIIKNLKDWKDGIIKDVLDIVAKHEEKIIMEHIVWQFGESIIWKDVNKLWFDFLKWRDIIESSSRKDEYFVLNRWSLFKHWKQKVDKNWKPIEWFINNVYYILPWKKLAEKKIFKDILEANNKKEKEFKKAFKNNKYKNKPIYKDQVVADYMKEVMDMYKTLKASWGSDINFGKILDITYQDTKFDQKSLIEKLFKWKDIDIANKVVERLTAQILGDLDDYTREIFTKNFLYNFSLNKDKVIKFLENAWENIDDYLLMSKLFLSDWVLNWHAKKIGSAYKRNWIKEYSLLNDDERFVYDTLEDEYRKYVDRIRTNKKLLESRLKKIKESIKDINNKIKELDVNDPAYAYDSKVYEQAIKELDSKHKNLVDTIKQTDKETLTFDKFVYINMWAVLEKIDINKLLDKANFMVNSFYDKHKAIYLQDLKKSWIMLEPKSSFSLTKMKDYIVEELDKKQVDLVKKLEELYNMDNGLNRRLVNLYKEVKEKDLEGQHKLLKDKLADMHKAKDNIKKVIDKENWLLKEIDLEKQRIKEEEDKLQELKDRYDNNELDLSEYEKQKEQIEKNLLRNYDKLNKLYDNQLKLNKRQEELNKLENELAKQHNSYVSIKKEFQLQKEKLEKELEDLVKKQKEYKLKSDLDESKKQEKIDKIQAKIDIKEKLKLEKEDEIKKVQDDILKNEEELKQIKLDFDDYKKVIEEKNKEISNLHLDIEEIEFLWKAEDYSKQISEKELEIEKAEAGIKTKEEQKQELQNVYNTLNEEIEFLENIINNPKDINIVEALTEKFFDDKRIIENQQIDRILENINKINENSSLYLWYDSNKNISYIWINWIDSSDIIPLWFLDSNEIKTLALSLDNAIKWERWYNQLIEDFKEFTVTAGDLSRAKASDKTVYYRSQKDELTEIFVNWIFKLWGKSWSIFSQKIMDNFKKHFDIDFKNEEQLFLIAQGKWPKGQNDELYKFLQEFDLWTIKELQDLSINDLIWNEKLKELNKKKHEFFKAIEWDLFKENPLTLIDDETQATKQYQSARGIINTDKIFNRLLELKTYSTEKVETFVEIDWEYIKMLKSGHNKPLLLNFITGDGDKSKKRIKWEIRTIEWVDRKVIKKALSSIFIKVSWFWEDDYVSYFYDLINWTYNEKKLYSNPDIFYWIESMEKFQYNFDENVKTIRWIFWLKDWEILTWWFGDKDWKLMIYSAPETLMYNLSYTWIDFLHTLDYLVSWWFSNNIKKTDELFNKFISHLEWLVENNPNIVLGKKELQDILFNNKYLSKNLIKQDKIELSFKSNISDKIKIKDQNKSNFANKFIWFGSKNTSTELYSKAWWDLSNSWDYKEWDTIFVSINWSKKNQSFIDKTIDEALKAISSWARLITDSEWYLNSSKYNEWEKQLFKILNDNWYKHKNIKTKEWEFTLWLNLEKENNNENLVSLLQKDKWYDKDIKLSEDIENIKHNESIFNEDDLNVIKKEISKIAPESNSISEDDINFIENISIAKIDDYWRFIDILWKINSNVSNKIINSIKAELRRQSFQWVVKAARKREASLTSIKEIFNWLNSKITYYEVEPVLWDWFIYEWKELSWKQISDLLDNLVDKIKEWTGETKEELRLELESLIKLIENNFWYELPKELDDYLKKSNTKEYVLDNNIKESVLDNNKYNQEIVDILKNLMYSDTQDWTMHGSPKIGQIKNFIDTGSFNKISWYKSHIASYEDWANLNKGYTNTESDLYLRWDKWEQILDDVVLVWSNSLKKRWGWKNLEAWDPKIIYKKINGKEVAFRVVAKREWSLKDFKDASSESQKIKYDASISSIVEWFDSKIADAFANELKLRVEQELNEFFKQYWRYSTIKIWYSKIQNITQGLLKNWQRPNLWLLFSNEVYNLKFKDLLDRLEDMISKPKAEGQWFKSYLTDPTIHPDSVIISPDSKLGKKLIERYYKDLEQEVPHEITDDIIDELNKANIYWVTSRYPVSDPLVSWLYNIQFSNKIGYKQIITHPENALYKLRADHDGDTINLYSLDDNLWLIIAKGIYKKAWHIWDTSWDIKELLSLNKKEFIDNVVKIKESKRLNTFLPVEEVDKSNVDVSLDLTLSQSRAAAIYWKGKISEVAAMVRTFDIYKNNITKFKRILDWKISDEEKLVWIKKQFNQLSTYEKVNIYLTTIADDKYYESTIKEIFKLNLKTLLQKDNKEYNNFNKLINKLSEITNLESVKQFVKDESKKLKEEKIKEQESKYSNNNLKYSNKKINNKKDLELSHIDYQNSFKKYIDNYIEELFKALNPLDNEWKSNKYIKVFEELYWEDIFRFEFDDIGTLFNKDKSNEYKLDVEKFKEIIDNKYNLINSPEYIQTSWAFVNLAVDFGNSWLASFDSQWFNKFLQKAWYDDEKAKYLSKIYTQISMWYNKEYKAWSLQTSSWIKYRLNNYLKTELKPLYDFRNLNNSKTLPLQLFVDLFLDQFEKQSDFNKFISETHKWWLLWYFGKLINYSNYHNYIWSPLDIFNVDSLLQKNLSIQLEKAKQAKQSIQSKKSKQSKQSIGYYHLPKLVSYFTSDQSDLILETLYTGKVLDIDKSFFEDKISVKNKSWKEYKLDKTLYDKFKEEKFKNDKSRFLDHYIKLLEEWYEWIEVKTIEGLNVLEWYKELKDNINQIFSLNNAASLLWWTVDEEWFENSIKELFAKFYEDINKKDLSNKEKNLKIFAFQLLLDSFRPEIKEAMKQINSNVFSFLDHVSNDQVEKYIRESVQLKIDWITNDISEWLKSKFETIDSIPNVQLIEETKQTLLDIVNDFRNKNKDSLYLDIENEYYKLSEEIEENEKIIKESQSKLDKLVWDKKANISARAKLTKEINNLEKQNELNRELISQIKQKQELRNELYETIKNVFRDNNIKIDDNDIKLISNMEKEEALVYIKTKYPLLEIVQNRAFEAFNLEEGIKLSKKDLNGLQDKLKGFNEQLWKLYNSKSKAESIVNKYNWLLEEVNNKIKNINDLNLNEWDELLDIIRNKLFSEITDFFKEEKVLYKDIEENNRKINVLLWTISKNKNKKLKIDEDIKLKQLEFDIDKIKLGKQIKQTELDLEKQLEDIYELEKISKDVKYKNEKILKDKYKKTSFNNIEKEIKKTFNKFKKLYQEIEATEFHLQKSLKDILNQYDKVVTNQKNIEFAQSYYDTIMQNLEAVTNIERQAFEQIDESPIFTTDRIYKQDIWEILTKQHKEVKRNEYAEKLFWTWNKEIEDDLFEEYRWVYTDFEKHYSLLFINDIKNNDKELFNVINWYSLLFGNDLKFVAKHRTWLNKISEELWSILDWNAKKKKIFDFTLRRKYKSQTIKFKDWQKEILSIFKKTFNYSIEWTEWTYKFNREKFFESFTRSVSNKFKTIIKYTDLKEIDRELVDKFNLPLKNDSISLWDLYAARIINSKDFKFVFDNYIEQVIEPSVKKLDEVDSFFGKRRWIVSKYKSETTSSIIEDIIWTMKWDINMALVDLWIHDKEKFLYRLTSKWFSERNAKILYSHFVDWKKHWDQYIWDFMNMLSYWLRYWTANILHFAWSISWLQQWPWQFSEIVTAKAAFNISDYDLQSVLNRYWFVTDEDTKIFANAISLQNADTNNPLWRLLSSNFWVNNLIDYWLVSDKQLVNNLSRRLRSWVDFLTNPLGYNDSYFDVQRRLAWIARAMYLSWYKNYEDVVLWISTYWQQELIRLQWEARMFYNELGWWVSSKNSLYKLNKIFATQWLWQDDWNFKWTLMRAWESIWGFLNWWAMAKTNSMIWIWLKTTKWLLNLDPKTLDYVSKMVSARVRNFMYLYLMSIKYDKYQDQEVRTNPQEVAKLLFNDYIAFQTLFSPIEKTFRMDKEFNYWPLEFSWALIYNLADRYLNSPTIISKIINQASIEYTNRNFKDNNFFTELAASIFKWLQDLWGQSNRYNLINKSESDINIFEGLWLSHVLWYWDYSDMWLAVKDAWDIQRDYKLHSLLSSDASILEKWYWILESLFWSNSTDYQRTWEIAKHNNNFIQNHPILRDIDNWKYEYKDIINMLATDKRFYKNWNINQLEFNQMKANILWVIKNHINWYQPDSTLTFDWVSNYTSEAEKKKMILWDDLFNKIKLEFINQSDWKNKVYDFGKFFYDRMRHYWLEGNNLSVPEMNHYVYESLYKKYQYKLYNEYYRSSDKFTESNWWKDPNLDWKLIKDKSEIYHQAAELAILEMWSLLNSDKSLMEKLSKMSISMYAPLQDSMKKNYWRYLQYNLSDSKEERRTNEQLEMQWLWLPIRDKYKNEWDYQKKWYYDLEKIIDLQLKDQLINVSPEHKIHPALWAFTMADVYGKAAIIRSWLFDTESIKDLSYQWWVLANSDSWKAAMKIKEIKDVFEKNNTKQEVADFVYTLNKDLQDVVRETESNNARKSNSWFNRYNRKEYSRKEYNRKPFEPYEFKQPKQYGWRWWSWQEDNPLQQFIRDNKPYLSANPEKVLDKYKWLPFFKSNVWQRDIQLVQWVIYNLLTPNVMSYESFIKETWWRVYGDWKAPIEQIVYKKKPKFIKNSKKKEKELKSAIKKTRISKGLLRDKAFNIIW